MRRLVVANLLVFAVLASATALAYYGWSYTAEVSSRERARNEQTLRAIGDEKIWNLENWIVSREEKVFEQIRLDQPRAIGDIVRSQQAPVVNAFLLDSDLALVGSGFHSKLPAKEATRYRDHFMTRILPMLPLRQLPMNTRGHLPLWDGEPRLFSYLRKSERGRDYYIVLEIDLRYVVGTLFEEFFGMKDSPQAYQVVDEEGRHVYGQPYTTSGIVVELPFELTVDNWRLRVAQRDADSGQNQRTRKVIDIVLIGLSLGGIVAGLAFLMFAMRRERKANELKSEFITNVSHELKTPLSIISMFGEMLALGRVKSAEQGVEYAEIIWRESVRLARLIDNVLDFAKIERGKDVYEFAIGDVADVVARAVELTQHRLQKAELDVVLELPEEPVPARLDANAFTLAVMNLLDNAIKYAADGKQVIVRVRHDGDRIVTEVQDFGAGIDPAEHGRIFERFYRAPSVRLKPIRGSGIGLALVDHIARAHNGGVGVNSALGKGSTFGLWVPAVDPDAAEM